MFNRNFVLSLIALIFVAVPIAQAEPENLEEEVTAKDFNLIPFEVKIVEILRDVDNNTFPNRGNRVFMVKLEKPLPVDDGHAKIGDDKQDYRLQIVGNEVQIYVDKDHVENFRNLKLPVAAKFSLANHCNHPVKND
jgi:hypothetical protein